MAIGIEATVAGFRNLSTLVPVKNSIVIFWQSHTKNPNDKSKIQSTIDLISKKFDLSSCENYEVRTGYLSRYNYLSKSKEKSQIEELEDAIVKGEEEQVEWIKRCNPNLEGFTQINWQECISKLKNPKFKACKDLLMKTIAEDAAINKAYKESSRAYAIKRKTNEENGFSYLVEENAWILSLPYLYPNKYIYVIHVGNVTQSTTLLWSLFEYLRESVRLLFPYFSKQKFKNLADFRSEYENKSNFGYFIDDECFKDVIANISKKEDLSKETLLKLLIDERSQKELLTNIIAKMPGHVYWLNKKYYFMGCNDVQAKDLGLNSRDDIIGKTVFDLLPEASAKKHNNINKIVIEKSKVWSGEEKASMYNGFKAYMSHKLPLTNSAGKNVGLLGISVDISDTKKKEKLKLKLKGQKELYALAQQVAHDIASPITSLKMVEYLSAEKLPDKEKEMLELAIASIEEMSNKLIEKYMVSKDENAVIVKQSIDRSEEMYIAPYLGLLEMVKRYEYRDNKNYDIKYYPDEKNKLVFIRGDYSDFSRMIANLIKNGAEAVEGKKGEIEVKYKAKGEEVEIVIKDNGKGMPKEIVERIKNDKEVRTTKEQGHGIGMDQIRGTLKEMKGKMEIKTQEGVGTEFILSLPKSEKPRWFADKIELKKGDTVVILDDEAIHEVWRARLSKYKDDVTFKYFTDGKETVEYLKMLEKKERVFLLTDYKLKNQDINGIDVIEKSNMKNRHILVTRLHLSKIKEFNEKSGFLKIFNKSLLNDIPIVFVN